MRSALRISLALVIVTAWGLASCAKAAAPVDPLAKWKNGIDYNVLPSPQETSAKPGKVEVAEVFWYGCGHCYALDPTIENWKKTKAAYIEFVRIPVMWGEPHLQHAQLYYTMQKLNRLDLHTKIFDTIHKNGNFLADQSQEKAKALQLAFAVANGISEADFNAAFDSPEVAANVQHAKEATYRYAVAGVPLLIVNGKYTTDVTMAGGAEKLIAIVNDLAASEKKR